MARTELLTYYHGTAGCNTPPAAGRREPSEECSLDGYRGTVGGRQAEADGSQVVPPKPQARNSSRDQRSDCAPVSATADIRAPSAEPRLLGPSLSPAGMSIEMATSDVNLKREAILKALCIHLGEDDGHLIREYMDIEGDDVTRDLQKSTMGIYVINKEGGEPGHYDDGEEPGGAGTGSNVGGGLETGGRSQAGLKLQAQEKTGQTGNRNRRLSKARDVTDCGYRVYDLAKWRSQGLSLIAELTL
ncbi:hypothetical protein F7725_028023 [Dissostichus mawsoni]|uniref:Uncharacterized protein n=1 Tax=Dissostichus mawsoni TaxID=36200 RepID=A0A7J5XEI2_DISMA|nr:hypothetical protein F7725_028023 [Dissostichus mawsoni]